MITVVHVDFSFMDSDLVTRMRLQHVRSFLAINKSQVWNPSRVEGCSLSSSKSMGEWPIF